MTAEGSSVASANSAVVDEVASNTPSQGALQDALVTFDRANDQATNVLDQVNDTDLFSLVAPAETLEDINESIDSLLSSGNFISASSAQQEALIALQNEISDQQETFDAIERTIEQTPGLAAAIMQFESDLAVELDRFSDLERDVFLLEFELQRYSPMPGVRLDIGSAESIAADLLTPGAPSDFSGALIFLELTNGDVIDLIVLDPRTNTFVVGENANRDTIRFFNLSQTEDLVDQLNEALSLRTDYTAAFDETETSAEQVIQLDPGVNGEEENLLTVALFDAGDALSVAEQELNNLTLLNEVREALITLNAAVSDFSDSNLSSPILLDDMVNATAGNDIFIFDNTSATINGFGASGDDVLFIDRGFDTVSFSRGVATPNDDDLQVFFSQEGSDTNINIASSMPGQIQISNILLVGVTLDDLSVDTDGLITIA